MAENRAVAEVIGGQKMNSTIRDLEFNAAEYLNANHHESPDAIWLAEQIDSVRSRYPNLLNAIQKLAAQMSLVEPSFAGQREACVAFVAHSTTLVAQAVAFLEENNKGKCPWVED
jgi:hypothetical protein